MKKILALVFSALLLNNINSYADENCPALLDHELTMLSEDNSVNLCDVFKDKVVLVVNTASRCAFTPQYDGLEKLYEKYKDKGLIVAGFPSNDFAGQEPGSEEEIKSFCRTTYGVKFPMFSKTRVTGKNIAPFYADLIQASGEEPSWNFYKYLINRDGEVVDSFSSLTKPDNKKLIEAIERLL